MSKFDPVAATQTYLAALPPEAHAKASAYTHGKEWHVLFGLVVSLAVAWVIVRTGVLKGLRDMVERGGQRKPIVATLLIAPIYLLMSAVIGLPWSIYSGWWYEKSFGLTSQPLAGWLTEQAIGMVISIAIGTIFFLALYFLINRAPKRWWLWGGVVTGLLTALALFAGPIFIEPIFNTYKEAPAGQVRDEVVALGKATGTPTDKIYIYDGSKQSNRYTANVSGLGSSARVAMSDTMFKQGADLAEVRGVVGHEMGHYVHQHSLWFLAIFTVMGMLGFWLAEKMFPTFARLLGSDARGVGDPSGVPVLMAVLSVLGFLATPLNNTLSRAVENDADSFSLEYAKEPDGLAKALVKTLEYRAATPGQIEEIIFYDHPSVSHRVRKAMDWKAAHGAVEPTQSTAPAAAVEAPAPAK